MKNEIKTKTVTKKTKKVTQSEHDKVAYANACMCEKCCKVDNTIPDSEATASQVKDWSKFTPQGEVDETSFNWTSFVLGVMLMGVVIAMISYNVTPFLEANDIFLPCK